MPFDVTCEEEKKSYLEQKERKKERKEKERRENLQCKNQVPGLSATTRRVMDSPGGIWNTSLRIGFACPSTITLSPGSEKLDDRATIIGLCPCKWLFLNKRY